MHKHAKALTRFVYKDTPEPKVPKADAVLLTWIRKALERKVEVQR